MNTLSFGVQIAGAPQAKNELREIIDLQAKLNRNNVLAEINPATVLRSPELLAELKRMTAAKMKVPPIIAPPVIGGNGIGGNGLRAPAWLRQAFFGAGGAISGSPFGTARALSAGSDLLGAGGAAIPIAVLLGEIVALTAAFKVLRIGVEAGSKLYQHAARLGTSVGKTFQLEALAKALGLSPGEVDTLAIRGSHPQRGERQAFFRQGDIGAMLGSGAGAGQLGSLQQIKNMGDYADRTFRDLAKETDDMNKNAKSLQEIHYMESLLGSKLQNIFAQLATALFPLIKKIAEDIYVLFTGVEWLLRKLIAAEAFVGLIPKGDPGAFKIQASRGTSASQASPWERMGFVIGGFAQHDYARQTAENTAEIAKNTKGTADFLKGLIPFGSKPGNDPAANHTFYHKITPLP